VEFLLAGLQRLLTPVGLKLAVEERAGALVPAVADTA
jgi:hypothetical protein